MASLIDRLRETLEQECSMYEKLLEVSRRKTPVIVAGKLEALTSITDEEQALVDDITHIDQIRSGVMTEIAKVLNTDVTTLKLDMLIRALEKKPAEQKKLAMVADKLGTTVRLVRSVNSQNKELIDSALEMINFEMNVIQSVQSAPETANYNRGAYNTGSVMGIEPGGFDAKQ